MGIPLPPPWVMLSLLLGFSRHVQDVKEIGALGWAIMRGRGENAGCMLCDKLVTVVLKEAELDEMSEGGGVDCASICFKVPSCIRSCEKITSAMTNSTGFPCIAAGLCPAADEFGEVSCKWSYKSMGCEPLHACEYKFPKCELRSGMKKWKQVSHLMSSHIGAFDDAFRHRKRCSEKDAGPYCIREAEGLGLLAEWGSLALTFLGGAACSIRAIETPGGDDDRQWLTFWMIMMLFFLAERFTDVLLSQLAIYYELKFFAVIWLMFFQGCAPPHTLPAYCSLNSPLHLVLTSSGACLSAVPTRSIAPPAAVSSASPAWLPSSSLLVSTGRRQSASLCFRSRFAMRRTIGQAGCVLSWRPSRVTRT